MRWLATDSVGEMEIPIRIRSSAWHGLLKGTVLALTVQSAAASAQSESPAGCETPPKDIVPSAGLSAEAFKTFDLDGNGRIDGGCEFKTFKFYVNALMEDAGYQTPEAKEKSAKAKEKSAEVGEKSAEASFPLKLRDALGRITAYEPIYFLVAQDADVGLNGKFQLSLNYTSSFATSWTWPVWKCQSTACISPSLRLRSGIFRKAPALSATAATDRGCTTGAPTRGALWATSCSRTWT